MRPADPVDLGRVGRPHHPQQQIVALGRVGRQIGGQTIRPGDAIVADDDGVCDVPRLDVAAAVTASAARIAKEDANRRELADGVLGLDLYNLRPKLARVEYISHAEYAKRAGEGS